MAALLVRKLDDRVVAALRQRAFSHHRSVEAEHRALLEEVLLTDMDDGFKALLARMPDVGGDDLFERCKDLPRETDL